MHRKTILQAKEDLLQKKYSAVELTKAVYKRIKSVEPKVQAYVHLTQDIALGQAQEADQKLAAGRDYPLLGIPIALKDLICMQGARTTCSSKMLDQFVSPYDATVVNRLKSAGAVILGKTNMDEFAMGSSTENSWHHPTMNPWDLSRVPGGSSGGSAAAVAAHECLAALGSDTGGSVRIPSALCGIVGIKPTFGMISRSASFAMSWSQDTPGPMTQNVTDCAIMLKSIAKHDSSDYNSAKFTPVDYYKELKASVDNIRIGIPDSFFFDIVDEEVKQAVLEAANVLKSLGAEIFEVKLELIEKSLDISTIIINAEASEIHSKDLENHASELDPGSRWRIELVNFVSAVDYIRAQRARSAFVKGLNTTFEKVDLLLTPTIPVLAPGLNETEILIQGKKEDPLPLLSRLTRPFNLSGHPAISLPCGFSNSGLPIGFQLVAPYFKEQRLLKDG